MRTWKPLAAVCLSTHAFCLAQAVGEGAAPAAPPQQAAQETQVAPQTAPQQEAQPTPPAAEPAQPAEPGKTDPPPFKQEELDQMLAPLALYPDALLSQILMASTYPLEIVLADRWMKVNKDLKDSALANELGRQTWDASVKSLTNFPEVLASLSEKLEWTTKIGDAFLADQKAVMDTIQKLRAKALEQGNLESNDKQKVTTEPAPAGASTTTVIMVESADPEVVYVPTYNPTVVYGSWWYPSYPPPYYYYPPAGAAFVGFSMGVAWGFAWGSCDWDDCDVDIDIDQNFEFNQNIDRDKAKNELKNRAGGDKGKWQHDSAHRRGTEYRDSATARKQGGASRAQATQAREAYRGRAESGRQQLSTDRAAGRIDSGGRPSSGPSGRAGQSAPGGRSPQAGALPSGGPSRVGSGSGSAFSRGGSGADVRRQSNRGSSSRGGGSRGGGRGGGGRRR